MSKRTKDGKTKSSRTKNPPAVEVTKEMLGKTTTCQFCHQGETKDILQSGRLYKLPTGGKTFEYYHYFCLLFSSQGIQRGKDEEGLNGFLLEDIKAEVKRGAGIRCDLCRQPGATIPCHIKKCKKNYHFTCGATTNPEHLFIFRNNMDSYCWSHAPQQKKTSHVVSDATCMVCLDASSLGTPGPGPGRLVSPCCGRTFHRDCVQKTALQAGKVSLKCPACNTKEKFNEEIERCGVYIPHADATWEMPENSNFYRFEDMLHLYRNCDAETCLSPRGRDHSKPGTPLQLVKCQTCGQSGVHVLCGKLELAAPVYVCSTCQPSTEEDSEGEDGEELQATLARHEDRRRELLERKDQLVREERERLAGTKRKQDEMIQRIKAIFAPDPAAEETGKVEEVECCGRREGVAVRLVNGATGGTVGVQPCPAPPRPRTAMGLPRKLDVAQMVVEDDSNDDDESDDEELKRVLRISAIFSGDDVGKLDAFLPADCLASPPPSVASSTISDTRSTTGPPVARVSAPPGRPAGALGDLGDDLEDLLADEFRD